jgi:hypothetical protein
MWETIGWLSLALVIVFTINMVPALMPSTWMVLAFFYIQFDLPLLLLTVSGAIVSGFGRIVLTKGSTWFKRRFMTDKERDLDELAVLLDERRHVLSPTVFVYALTPLPTNNLFIAAGMAEVNLAWVLAGFWSARIIADTFWVWTTSEAFDTFGDVFGQVLDGPTAILLQLMGLTSIFLLYKLPWARWLRRYISKEEDTEAAG